MPSPGRPADAHGELLIAPSRCPFRCVGWLGFACEDRGEFIWMCVLDQGIGRQRARGGQGDVGAASQVCNMTGRLLSAAGAVAIPGSPRARNASPGPAGDGKGSPWPLTLDLDEVRETLRRYYGEKLRSSADLATAACCTDETARRFRRHPEVDPRGGEEPPVRLRLASADGRPRRARGRRLRVRRGDRRLHRRPPRRPGGAGDRDRPHRRAARGGAAGPARGDEPVPASPSPTWSSGPI